MVYAAPAPVILVDASGNGYSAGAGAGGGALDASFQQVTANGTLGALNANLAISVGRRATLTLHVTGAWVGTISLQGSLDGGTTWVTINAAATWIRQDNGTYSGTIGTNAIYQTGCTGLTSVRVAMTSYTSGSANVYLVASDEPAAVALDTPIPAGTNTIGWTHRAPATADGVANGSIDEVAIGAFNGTTIDRLYNATSGSSTGSRALLVATGITPNTSLNAAAAIAAGAGADNFTARPHHTIQVDITTTAAGTALTHTVLLQGSLDNVNWTTLATVSPASTSTTASDVSNHASASVANMPYRYIRANWTTIPTSWTGTLTARVVSA